MRQEADQPSAYLLFTITDEQGNAVRKIKTDAKKGVNRIVWDFRYSIPTPISLEPVDDSVPWNEPGKGYMAVPGKYFVSLSKFEDGKFTELVKPMEFVCKPLNIVSLPAEDKIALNAFNQKVSELTRAITGLDAYRKELVNKLSYLKKAVIEEYALGAHVNFNYFYSMIDNELELLGTDTRRQTNLDGLIRLPATDQIAALKFVKPKMIETGHLAVTVKESLLEKIFDIGERFVSAAKNAHKPGIIGPFALQGAVVADEGKEEIVIFDVSMRIPGSPGTMFTPYSGYLYHKPISVGERIAMEIKKELIDTENISFVILDDKAAIEAAEIAAKTGLRGMDALMVQVAKEYNAELISFDKEMMRKSRTVLKKR